ncbi:MAG: DMT family transporter, partial [Pseudomonadota bacterium]
MSGRNQPQRAMVLMVVAMAILPGIDAIAKWLTASMGTVQITAARFLFQSLFLLPFAWSLRESWSTRSLLWNAARGVLIATTTTVFWYSLTFLPLAEAIAIFFVEPLILTVLSSVFFGERVGWRRYSAVLIGLLGALIVIRPNFAAIGWIAALPLCAALCFALYLLITRHLAPDEDPASMQFVSGIFGALFMGALLWLGYAADWSVIAPVWPSFR